MEKSATATQEGLQNASTFNEIEGDPTRWSDNFRNQMTLASRTFGQTKSIEEKNDSLSYSKCSKTGQDGGSTPKNESESDSFIAYWIKGHLI